MIFYVWCVCVVAGGGGGSGGGVGEEDRGYPEGVKEGWIMCNGHLNR